MIKLQAIDFLHSDYLTIHVHSVIRGMTSQRGFCKADVRELCFIDQVSQVSRERRQGVLIILKESV